MKFIALRSRKKSNKNIRDKKLLTEEKEDKAETKSDGIWAAEAR